MNLTKLPPKFQDTTIIEIAFLSVFTIIESIKKSIIKKQLTTGYISNTKIGSFQKSFVLTFLYSKIIPWPQFTGLNGIH